MKSAVQVLTEARELLSDESKWTQGLVARNSDGGYVHPHSSSAVCFCSLGAISKVTRLHDEDFLAVSYLQKITGGSLSLFNDAPNRKHSEILEAFDKAIELAKEGEKV